jgi:hypothetical protein
MNLPLMFAPTIQEPGAIELTRNHPTDLTIDRAAPAAAQTLKGSECLLELRAAHSRFP